MDIFDREWYPYLDDPKWRQSEWERIVTETKWSLPNLDLNHLRVDDDWVHISEWWVIMLQDSWIWNYQMANDNEAMSVLQWERLQEILSQFSEVPEWRKTIARNVLGLLLDESYWLCDENYNKWYCRILVSSYVNSKVLMNEHLSWRIRKRVT